MLVCWNNYKEVLQTGGLTTEINSLTVLEARSLTPGHGRLGPSESMR